VGKRLAGKGVAETVEEVCEETVPISSSCSARGFKEKKLWGSYVPCVQQLCLVEYYNVF